MAKKLNRQGKPRKARPVTLAHGGSDHGPTTEAQLAGSYIEAVEDDKNGRNRRRRVNILSLLLKADKLTQAQFQAGTAIEEAYCRVQSLSSGGPLKERVQSSPKPDAQVSAQVAAMSEMVRVKRTIPQRQRELVEHVCELNQPLRTARGARKLERLRDVLEIVARDLGY